MSPRSPNWSEADIPDLGGRTAIVTGANTGLGLETARALAEHGAAVVLAVRDVEKGKAALASISARCPAARVWLQSLDLTSLASVRRAAHEIVAEHARIDLLVNNAGVMYTPKSRTADGFELQLGTNHFGHFALTGLLLPRMLEVPGSRVVSVSSIGHRIRSAIDLDDLAFERGYGRVAAYGRSKLANLLFTYELQRRLANAGAATSALAAHPGVSATELMRNSPAILRSFEGVLRPLAQSAAMGALPTLRAATDPGALGGEYYGPDGFAQLRGHPVRVESSARSHDADLQRGLWKASEESTGVPFPV
jgi:NAD(P)-dependent dehydrogenase (short-subunit alcohol dehydrogenase family)